MYLVPFNYVSRCQLPFICHSHILLFITFLGALVKFRKATISFVLSVCSSVGTKRLVSLMGGFSCNLMFECFPEIQVRLKCDKNNEYIAWKTYVHL
jgi:hypothetical protein